MQVRRKQTQSEGTSYSFQDYLKELERGETEDPEEPNRAAVKLALQEMMKSSDALQKVPLLQLILYGIKEGFKACMLIDSYLIKSTNYISVYDL